MVFIKDNAKVMADLLKAGQKMLNLSCPICNNPIFKKKNGDIYCPICNRKALLVDNPQKIKEEENNPISANATEIDDIKKVILTVLKEKLQWITQKLEKESQLNLLREYLEISDKILDLIEKVLNFK